MPRNRKGRALPITIGFTAVVLAAQAAPALAIAAATPSASGQPASAHHHAALHPVPRVSTAAQSRALAEDRVASAAAVASRRPVAVASQTTQTSITIAKPNGALETIANVLPVRVKVGRAWQSVNATLHRLPSGRWAPLATPSLVTLSGGGPGPLVSFASPAGGRLSLTLRLRLPAPAVSGATATYRSVLPGVDLRLTANTLGGITETWTIRDAAAAASPALRNLRLGLATRGLQVSSGRSGNLTATRKDGLTEFTGTVPVIWDSRHAALTSGPARAGGFARSTAAGPGLGARVAPVAARITAGSLMTLTPPAGLLTTAASFPAYLAGSISPAAFTASSFSVKSLRGTNGYAMVRDNCTGTPDWNNPNPGVGWQDYSPDCGGGASLYRTFFDINVSNLDPSMKVQQATLTVFENYGADFNCNDHWTLTTKWTGPINSGTDWSNQPKVDSRSQTRTYSLKPALNKGNDNCPSSVPADFDVTYAMTQAAAGGWAGWTFGLYGDESKVSTNYGFMRYGTNPQIVTTFDLAPPAPATSTLKETPAPKDTPGGAADYGCGSTTGWINQTTASLQATVVSYITNEKVRAEFETFDNTGSVSPGPANSPYQASGTVASTAVPGTLVDGHQYNWNVAANVDGSTPGSKGGTDGNNTTGYTTNSNASCFFNVDLTAPKSLAVTSTDYPASGTGTSSKQPGQSGTFTFSAFDPVSTTDCFNPCVASGVYRFYYSLNSPVPSGGGGTFVSAGANSNGSTARVTTPAITVGNWGTNILYVEAQDTAGNFTQPVPYTFYVPWNNTADVTPGDVNGDVPNGIPDLLGTTSTNLDLFPGDADPAASPVTAGSPGSSPDGTGWNTFQITHRGSFSQGRVDDLFVHKGNNLWIYLNNSASPGAAPQFGNTADLRPILADPTCATTFPDGTTRPGNCAGYVTSGNWSAVSQILAPGDAWTGSTMDNGEPSLLTVENGQLWLYQGQFGDALNYPVLLGSSGGTTNWSNMTLIAPGLVNGPTGQLTLWARDNNPSDPNYGAIYSYPITLGTDDLPTLSPASPGTPVTAASGTIITGLSLPGSSYPAVGSPGPLDNSSFPGLYAEKTTGTSPSGASCASGCLYYYPGQSTAGGLQPLDTNPTDIVYVGTLSILASQLS